MMIGLGITELAPTPAAALFTGPEGLERARQLVDLDYCSQLACGAIQQREAGVERVQACGLAYPLGVHSWCSNFCAPYLPTLESRYGQTICGGTITPPPAPSLAENPLPRIVQPSPSVPIQALPAPLQPTSTTMIDEVTCPSCQGAGAGADCLVKLGGCCLGPWHLAAIACILIYGVTR